MQVRVLCRVRPACPIARGAMMMVVWGRVGHCLLPIVLAMGVAVSRRERAEVEVSATERGREW